MRILTKKEVFEFTGGINRTYANDEASNTLIGMVIGGVLCNLVFNTNFLGTVAGMLLGGYIYPELMRSGMGTIPKVFNNVSLNKSGYF